jgi:hypothetical protein
MVHVSLHRNPNYSIAILGRSSQQNCACHGVANCSRASIPMCSTLWSPALPWVYRSLRQLNRSSLLWRSCRGDGTHYSGGWQQCVGPNVASVAPSIALGEASEVVWDARPVWDSRACIFLCVRCMYGVRIFLSPAPCTAFCMLTS